MSAPRTSIITASRNRPGMLAEAIDSVCAQTDSDWEHIVIDDGSDVLEVRETLLDARAKDKRLTAVFCIEPLRRPARLWNMALDLCRGEFVTILDDDNRKHPRFLERMVGALKKNEALDAVTCGWQRIDESGRVLGASHTNLETTPERLYEDNTIDSNAIVFRRRVLDKIGMALRIGIGGSPSSQLFREDIGTGEDWHFVIRLVRHCKVEHSPDALIDYRVHAGAQSQTVSTFKRMKDLDAVRRELYPRGRP